MSDQPDASAEPRTQYGALPYRRTAAGGLEILLATSRETRRWVIPKGWPMKHREPHKAAAREALEEAGIEGKVGKEAIGFYLYDKRLKDGSVVPCRVEVFPLAVELQREDWREKDERTTRWFAPDEAAAAVNEPTLRDLIRSFAAATLAAAKADRTGEEGRAYPLPRGEGGPEGAG